MFLRHALTLFPFTACALITHCALPSTPSAKPTPSMLSIPNRLLDSNAAQVVHGVLECPCTKTSFGVTRSALRRIDDALRVANDELDRTLMHDNRTRADAQAYATTLARAALAHCARLEGYEACVNAADMLRAAFARPLCTYDNATRNNLVMSGKMLSLAPKCFGRFKSKHLQSPLRDALIKPVPHVIPKTWRKDGMTEGCVAVEHLNGFALQHRQHLRRPVLCADNFCATPNHAILFKGTFTSMKRLCAGQLYCTAEVRLVNNLKVAVNRRAEVSDDIVVTPYDIRFPKALVWAAQMTEDAIRIVSKSLGVGVLLTASFLVYIRIQNSI
eukprot:IDg14326t1